MPEDYAAEVEINFYNILNRYRLPDEPDYRLATRIGVPPTTLGNWKLGRQPRFDQIMRMAVALGKTPWGFIEEALAIHGEIKRAKIEALTGENHV